MGRPRTTGRSHNKKSVTYRSVGRLEETTKANDSQRKLTDLFKKKSDTPKSNEGGEQSAPLDTDTDMTQDLNGYTPAEDSSSDESFESISECEDEVANIDGRSYLVVHQAQEKWENLFPFAYYSASKNGWLCKTCSGYGGGDDYWRSKGVKLKEHPRRLFTDHSESKKHLDAIKRRQEVDVILRRGSIYKQAHDGAQTSDRKLKKRNRSIIKKFLKTTYFLARKKWAVRENFCDVVEFLKDLGDEDIANHLRESRRATYVSTTSTDEFLKCLSDHLEEEFLSRLAAASDFSLMADETTDVADRAELSIFIRYVDADTHQISEKFLGLVEVVEVKVLLHCVIKYVRSSLRRVLICSRCVLMDSMAQIR